MRPSEMGEMIGGWCERRKIFWAKLLGQFVDGLLDGLGCFGGAGRAIFKVKWEKQPELQFFYNFQWVLAYGLGVDAGSKKVFWTKLLERSPDGLLNGLVALAGLRKPFSMSNG